jgi:hypothetical protein
VLRLPQAALDARKRTRLRREVLRCLPARKGRFRATWRERTTGDGRVNPLRVVGPGEYVNALVKTLSLERAAILDDPGALLRVKEPPIEMVWGYVLAVTHCIERLEIRRSRWRLFLLDQDLDEPYAYKRMIANQTFGDRIAFMRKLFDDFDAWRAAQESK